MKKKQPCGDFMNNLRKTMRIMRLSLFFLLISTAMSFSASSYSQSKKLTLNLNNATVKEILKAVEEQSEFLFFYQEKHLDLNRKASVQVHDKGVEAMLKQLFAGTDNIYVINGRQIVIGKAPRKELEKLLPSLKDDILSVIEQPQQKEIKGKVTDDNGEPMVGVNIVVTGTTIGTISDMEGNYTIGVPLTAETLTYSFIGMVPQTVAIGNSTVINISLEASSESLDEVVITALGIERQVKAIGFAAQEIGGDDLTAARDVNISSFLTGKIAGVQVSRTAGGPTGSTNVTIRGNSSLTGNSQPLYVVDGVPIINLPKSVGGLYDGETDYGDGIGDINPEDVLSMTVLKGPNASSLYGSRGANGVILITTKMGKQRKGIGVEVNSNVSIETINQIPRRQNKYGPGWDDANLNGQIVQINGKDYETMPFNLNFSWGPPLNGTRTVADPYLLPGESPRPLTLTPQPIDNVRDFYNTGVTTQNTVALSGGNDKTSGRVSFGNTTYKGIVPNHKVEKQSISARLTSQMTDFLSFDAKVNYIHDEGDQRPTLGYSVSNPNYVLAYMGRTVPMGFLKDYYEMTGTSGQFPGLWGINPYYIINELKNSDYRDRMLGYISATLNFTEWLSLMGRAGVDFYTEYHEKSWPIGSLTWDYPNGGILSDLMHNKDFNADAILSANKEMSGNFSISASLGASLLKQHRDQMQIIGKDLRAEGVYHISNANIITPYQSLYEKEMQSVYFIGQLSYKNYLFLDITGRNDWSSALGINDISYFYPSVGTSFVFSEALGMNDRILSFGKVRLSWAQVGNDSEPYLTKSGYNLYPDGINGQGFISTPGTVPLIDLKNELTESWEIGADLRFFKNRLSIDATYYNGHTTNQIIPARISTASGYESIIINAGRIDNKGFEAILTANPVKTANGFRWDLNFNYSRNKNTVVELAEGIDSYILNDGFIGPNLSINATVGHPFGEIIGLDTKKAPDGQYIVAENGRYVNADETSVLGNIQPDWIGGLNNTFSYKNLSMNVLIDFVQGGNLFSNTKHEMTARGTGKWTEVGREGGVLPGVVEVKDGDGNVTGYEPNTTPVTGQDYWLRRARGQGNWFVLDASYIMLREVMLNYRFHASVLNKTPFENLTLSLYGRNLFYFEEHMEDMGISPESAPNTNATFAGYETFSTPSTRTFGLNVKLSF